MKKALFVLFLFIALIGSVLWIFDLSLRDKILKGPCVFCDPKILDAQKFYEDDLVVGLYDYKSICPGHCVLIPKRHVERLENLSEQESLALFQLIQKTHKSVQKAFFKQNYFILQKNGDSAGQTVPHVHIHFIPRNRDQRSLLAFLWSYCLHPFQKALSQEEMELQREKVRQNL